VLKFQDGCYLYLDAGGCLSAVYSQELGIAGATAASILSSEAYDSRRDMALYRRLDVAREGWFPSGLTGHRGVSRLLCNHRLDLQAMKSERCWPVAPPQRNADEDAVLERLGAALRDNLDVVFDHYRAAIAVTGGGDSRSLLSLLRHRRDRLVTYIVDAGPGTALDIHLSQMVAEAAGLKRQVLLPLGADPENERRWHFRAGHAVGGSNAHIHTALSHLEDCEAIIDGSGGETGRCFFWKDGDSEGTVVTSDMIAQRLGMPSSREVVEATQLWLQGVPKGDAFFTLDLAYLELRNSAWAYAQSYTDPSLLHFSPYLSRRTVSAMFELPISTKRAGFPKAIILRNWPDLAAVPYNRYGDARDWMRLARKATDPRRVLKKVRKLLAP
jgi:hypothetical protein